MPAPYAFIAADDSIATMLTDREDDLVHGVEGLPYTTEPDVQLAGLVGVTQTVRAKPRLGPGGTVPAPTPAGPE